MRAPPDKRRTAPAGNKGGSIFDSNNRKIECADYSNSKRPTATPAIDLISVSEACGRSGEKPAVIIGWCVHLGIGGHFKTDSGGGWMVDPDRLERLLAERAAAS